MTIPNETFCNGAHIHQLDVLKAFDERNTWSFWLEWARRHRKTTLAINLLIREACRYEKAKYIYLSPYQAETRKIVWDDPTMLPNALPDKKEMDYKKNDTKMLVTFDNGSMIQFGGSDEPDSIRGVDAIGVVLDERALMKEVVWTEILLPVIMGDIPPHLVDTDAFRWVLNLYTPKGINHATVGFDKACCLNEGGVLPECGKAEKMKPGYYASRLDGELAGIMSNAALQIAKEEAPLVLYEQEFRCRRVTSEEMTLITSQNIYDLNEYHRKTMKTITGNRRIVSIDPAWGGDVCKIMGLVEYEEKESATIRDKHRASEIVMAGKVVAQKISTKNFIIDCVNDVAVAEGLEDDEAGYNVQRFKSSHKATEKLDSQQAIRFYNRRAEAYHLTSKLITSFEAGPIKNKELIRQLPIASRYTTKGASGRLIIIPKLKIKEELGCSPDEVDTYVMGCWGTQFVYAEEDSVSVGKRALNSMVPSHLIRTF